MAATEKPKQQSAIAMAKEACAEIRKLKKQLRESGLVSEMRTGRDALKEMGKGGHVKLTALIGICILVLGIVGINRGAEVLRSGWGLTENFGDYAVYGDAATDNSRLIIDDLTVQDDITIADDLTVTGDLAVTGDSTLSGDTTIQSGLLIGTQVNIASTNLGVITVNAAMTYVLSAAAQANATVTNTIVAPASPGTWAVLINGGASNSIVITEGATLDSGGIKTLGPEDVMMLFAPSAASWSAIYHDN